MLLNLIVSNSHSFVKQTIDKNEKNCDSLIRIDYLTVPLDEILYEFSSVSLFEPSKLILVENCDEIFSKDFSSDDLKAYFEHPSDISTIYFAANKVDKTSELYKIIDKNYKVFQQEDDKSRFNNNNNILLCKKYIMEHGSSITDKALNYIKDATLNNYDLMISEINKLLILGKTNISDELVYGLVNLTPDGNTNRLIDALLDEKGEEALTCVRNMEILNVDLTKLIALIAWNLRLMYLFKINRKDQNKINEVMKLYNVKDFTYNKLIRRANLHSSDELEDMLLKLADIEIGIKEFRITKEQVGYYLINLFCI